MDEEPSPLAVWLREAEETRHRLASLKSVEERVVLQRDYEALTPFISSEPRQKRWVPGLEQETRPSCVLNIANSSGEDIERTVERMKHYFPDAELRRMHDSEGNPVLALIGVDHKLANAAEHLEAEKQRAGSELRRLQQDIQQFTRQETGGGRSAPAAPAGRSRREPSVSR